MHIQIGGKDLEVKPLVLSQIRKLMVKDTPHNKALSGLGQGVLSNEQFDAILDIAAWGLDGNKGVDRKWIEQNITLDELNRLLLAVMEISGMIAPNPKA